ncbi:NADH-quinone oxidoreductase subunit NuoE [Bacteroidetes/Chlorobi group bacterium ChocPot_Mid]|jgi:NADH-quinone oxidoreductase E subunit|nr:MAG: NADH-quinone oxidoreductase subunit NuoE [Bacteroidetes/Chlorobi group bacterium ChocPot_Mid]
MAIEFSQEELQKIEEIKKRYPEQKAAIMPVLWMAQKKFGWLSDEVKQYVADLLGLSYAHVHGVVSFYTMYFKKPMGKYHIQVCTNVSCMLLGGEEIYIHLCDKLGIKHLETTSDGKFSLEEVECMGACGGAPMIAINEDYYENMDINKVDALIDSLR